MPNEVSVETVLQGQYPPARVPPRRSDWSIEILPEYRSARKVVDTPFTRFEYQEIPGDLLGDSDFIQCASEGKPLPDKPRLGSWLVSTIQGMSNIGRILKTEVSAALTMDRRGGVYESSVHDISAGPRAAFSWVYKDGLPKGHTLLAQIHTHLPEEMIGVNPEGFSSKDLLKMFSLSSDWTVPYMMAVGTPEGIYTSLSLKERSLFWTIAEFLSDYWKGSSPLFRERLLDSLETEMRAIDNTIFADQAWWRSQMNRREDRLAFQKEFCKRYKIKLYFTSQRSDRSTRII